MENNKNQISYSHEKEKKGKIERLNHPLCPSSLSYLAWIQNKSHSVSLKWFYIYKVIANVFQLVEPLYLCHSAKLNHLHMSQDRSGIGNLQLQSHMWLLLILIKNAVFMQ